MKIRVIRFDVYAGSVIVGFLIDDDLYREGMVPHAATETDQQHVERAYEVIRADVEAYLSAPPATKFLGDFVPSSGAGGVAPQEPTQAPYVEEPQGGEPPRE